jgi:hypothetical protein
MYNYLEVEKYYVERIGRVIRAIACGNQHISKGANQQALRTSSNDLQT